MPRALPKFLPLPPACDEWKLEAALREAGYPVTVKRTSRTSCKVSASSAYDVETLVAYVKGWIAGANSH